MRAISSAGERSPGKRWGRSSLMLIPRRRDPGRPAQLHEGGKTASRHHDRGQQVPSGERYSPQRPRRLVAAHRHLAEDAAPSALRPYRPRWRPRCRRSGPANQCLLDADMIKSQPAADRENRGEQQRHPRQRRPAADQDRDQRDHDCRGPGPALRKTELARGETAPILRQAGRRRAPRRLPPEQRSENARGRALMTSKIAQHHEPANERRRDEAGDQHQPALDKVADRLAESPQQGGEHEKPQTAARRARPR